MYHLHKIPNTKVHSSMVAFLFVFIMLDFFITNFQYRIYIQEAITTFIKHLIFFLQLKTWFKPLVINKITKRFVAEL